jgi:hypothetical protein
LPMAGAVHDCADADTAHKMRDGCDLQGLETFCPTNEDASINTHC